MSSIWNIVKRHRGKLVVGAALMGGLYAARRYLQEHPETWNYYVSQFSSGGVRSSEPGRSSRSEQLQTDVRKSYLFDSNQRTCDTSIFQLLPNIRDKIQKKFDVEKLAEDLKNCRYSNEQEKLELWNQMKAQSIARVLCSAYGYSLLIIALKAQMSILSSSIYEQAQRSRSMPRNLSTFFEVMTRWGGGDANLLNDASDTSRQEDSAGDQQLFLQCIQYFLVHGIEHLMDKVHRLVSSLCRAISLKDEFSPERARELVGEARRLLETGDCRNFSYFVVPMTANLDVFASHSDRLTDLLAKLKAILESEGCRKLIWGFGETFADETVKFLGDNSPDDSGESAVMPMAKVIPIFTDCFRALSSGEPDGVIRRIMGSRDLHEFCVKIYDGKVGQL